MRVLSSAKISAQATETAVSAAISTPVFASTLAVASTRIPAGSSPWLQPSRTRYLNGHYLRAASDGEIMRRLQEAEAPLHFAAQGCSGLTTSAYGLVRHRI
jgi:hypothetical protein